MKPSIVILIRYFYFSEKKKKQTALLDEFIMNELLKEKKNLNSVTIRRNYILNN